MTATMHRDRDTATTTDATHDQPPGHAGGHGDHAAAFGDRFWWSLILALPVVASSHQLQEWLGFSVPPFARSTLVAPVLGTVVFLYGGWPFLVGGVGEARDRRPGP